MTRDSGVRGLAVVLVAAAVLTATVTPALAAGIGPHPAVDRDGSGVTAPQQIGSGDGAVRATTPPDVRSDGPAVAAAEADAGAGAGPADAGGPGVTRADGAGVVGRVTLVTGQTVTVVERNGERTYRVDADVPMTRVSTGEGTYVYPQSVTFERFHRSLFDVDLLVEQNLTDRATDAVPVIVQYRDDAGVQVASGRDVVGSDGGELAAELGVDPQLGVSSARAVAGSVPKARAGTVADRLAASRRVERVYLNYRVSVANDRATNATATRQARDRFGVSGTNVTVAVLDTGVDETHPDLASREIAERNFVLDENTTRDLDGHGTHVAGTVAGTGAASNGTYAGYAPNASIVDVRVLGADGSGSFAGVLAGIEFAYGSGADVISMSLGAPQTVPRYDSLITPTVTQATNAGSLVVVSAGNDGPGEQTIGTPAIARDAVAVGASTDADDGLTDFSSRGPTAGFFVKPDIAAPGESITSANAFHEFPGQPFYVNRSGTSMAAPGVSGAAALVLDANPGLSPRQVKDVLIGSADTSPTASVYAQGGGRLNTTDAVASELQVRPGTVDFGLFTTDRNDSQELVLENTANRSLTATLSASATGIVRGTEGDVRLGETTVAVPAGGTATVPLEVRSGTTADVFSGRVIVDVAETGETYTTSFGYARGFPVRVEKRAASGAAQSVEGDQVLFQANRSAFDDLRTATYAPSGQRPSFVSLGGEVTVASVGTDEETGKSILTATTASINGPTTVRLDERSTVAYEIDTGGLDRPVAPATFETSLDAGGTSIGVLALGTTSSRVSTGTDLAVGVEGLYTPAAVDPPAGAPLDVPGAYLLQYSTTGVTGPETFTPTESGLARLNVTYYRSSDGQAYAAAPTAVEPGDLAPYLSLGPNRSFHSIRVRPGLDYAVAARGTNATSNETWSLAPHVPASPSSAGETVELSVDEQPFTGRRLDWTTGPDGFNFRVAFQTDVGGSVYATSADLNRLIVDTDALSDDRTEFDLRLPSEDFPTVGLVNPVPVSEGGRIHLVTVGRNSVQSLGTRTLVNRSATYTPGGDSTPPQLVGVRVEGLEPNTSVAPGNRTIRVAVAEQSTLSLSVRVGEDLGDAPFRTGAGRTATVTEVERRGNVTIYEANVSVDSTLDPLDIAVEATDESGNLVRVVTTDAVRVSGVAGPGDLTGDGRPATDVDGDGLFEDVDGDGRFQFTDVVAMLFFDLDALNANDAVRRTLDFDGDGSLSFLDVVTLLFEL
jgi:subtilisin family serine protease